MPKAIFIFLLLLIGSLILSCGDPTQPTVTKVETKILPVEISEADLFKGNKIVAFLNNETKFISEANALFLKGLNKFKNDKNLDSANYYLRQSILKEPSGKAYYELGNVFMDMKDYDKALLSYGMAEQLDFQPFSKLLYNKSCLYSLQKDTELSGKYLEYALQAGYTNVDHINQDKDLEELRKSPEFKVALKKGLRGMSNSDNLFWLQFKKLFAKPDLPQKIQTKISEEDISELVFISYEFEKYIAEMRDEKFSREVSKGFYYFSQPFETDAFVAVVYIVKDEFMGEYAPLTYKMATFTHEGKLIDKRVIAGRALLSEPLMEASINKDRSIDIKLLDPVYEKDPEEVGYYENPLIETKLIGSMKLKVNKSGKITVVESSDVSMAE